MAGGSRRGSSNSAWPRRSPIGGGRRPRPWANCGRPASNSSTSSSAPSMATTARTSRSASSCGLATADHRFARSAASRPRPGHRHRAIGANSAASTSATPRGRRPSTPSSWSRAIAARRPSSAAARWTSSPGITSTTRPTGGSVGSPRSTGSTTSRRASRGVRRLGTHQRAISCLRSHDRIPCRCLRGPLARTEGEDRATGRRLQGPGRSGPAVRRPGRAPDLDRRGSGGAGDRADLPGHRPVGGGELGGGEAVLAAAARVVARAV